MSSFNFTIAVDHGKSKNSITYDSATSRLVITGDLYPKDVKLLSDVMKVVENHRDPYSTKAKE